jgi:hypothetical protein
MDPVVIYAQSFVDSFGADCGVRLETIAATIGLRIEEVAAGTFDGALIRVAGKPVGKILLNIDIREEGRRLFTLAHEVGHYVLPTHSKSGALCHSREVQSWAPALPAREIEANRFAAEILIPRKAIIEQLRMEPSFKAVRQVANRFRTSLTASIYRLVELSSYRVAVVWSSAGLRIWYKASDEFGRAIELGPVSPDSFAADCFRRETVPDHPESVKAAAWLYGQGLNEDARILEQSVPLPYYNAVLSLLYIRDPIEAAEEIAEEETELDPLEFTLARKRWPKK